MTVFPYQGEKLCYWSLMERVENTMSELLLGWVELPPDSRKEMRVVLQPEVIVLLHAVVPIKLNDHLWKSSEFATVCLPPYFKTDAGQLPPAVARRVSTREQLSVWRRESGGAQE